MRGNPVDWQQLSTSSHYQTAVAVEEALKRGDTAEAQAGIEELIDALARSEKRALRSQLTRLMAHIVKWKTQPKKRCKSWRATINTARREIADIQEETPSLNRQIIEELWDRCFQAAKEDAEAEMDEASKVTKLTWSEVFEKEYEPKY
jgi:hypothetical protein